MANVRNSAANQSNMNPVYKPSASPGPIGVSQGLFDKESKAKRSYYEAKFNLEKFPKSARAQRQLTERARTLRRITAKTNAAN